MWMALQKKSQKGILKKIWNVRRQCWCVWLQKSGFSVNSSNRKDYFKIYRHYFQNNHLKMLLLFFVLTFFNKFLIIMHQFNNMNINNRNRNKKIIDNKSIQLVHYIFI